MQTGIIVVVIIAIIAGGLGVVLMTGGGPEEQPEEQIKGTLKIARATWVGSITKALVFKRVVEKELPYKVEIIATGGISSMYTGVSEGSADLTLSHINPLYKDIYKKTNINTFTIIEDRGSNSLFIPMKAKKAGIETLDDLKEYEDNFDKKVMCAKPGWSATEYGYDFVKRDKFSNWKVEIAGSTPSLVARIMSRNAEGKWWAATHWAPSTISAYFDTYPIHTFLAYDYCIATRPGFEEDFDSDLKDFLKNLYADKMIINGEEIPGVYAKTQEWCVKEDIAYEKSANRWFELYYNQAKKAWFPEKYGQDANIEKPYSDQRDVTID